MKLHQEVLNFENFLYLSRSCYHSNSIFLFYVYIHLILCVPHVCQNLIYSLLLKNIFLHNKAFLINLLLQHLYNSFFFCLKRLFSSKNALTNPHQQLHLYIKSIKIFIHFIPFHISAFFDENIEVSDENHFYEFCVEIDPSTNEHCCIYLNFINLAMFHANNCMKYFT